MSNTLGFDDKSLSSMAGAKLVFKNRQSILRILDEHADDLTSLMNPESTGFTKKNLSNMLSKAGENGLEERIETLVAKQDQLAAIIKQGPFNAANVANMLSGLGGYFASGIDVLISNHDRLVQIVAVGPFAAQNISGLLCGARANQEAIIQMLESKDNINKMRMVLENGPFDETNLSNMFHSKGLGFILGLDIIQSRLPQVQTLCAAATPGRLATQLSNVAVKDLAETIDRMYAHMVRAQTTVIPANAGATIAGGSLGTHQTEARDVS